MTKIVMTNDDGRTVEKEGSVVVSFIINPAVEKKDERLPDAMALMMGAGAPGDGGYGVRDFKAKFGGELVEYGRFRYVANKPLYTLGKWAVNLMKKR